jgi:hypothetical protein
MNTPMHCVAVRGKKTTAVILMILSVLTSSGACSQDNGPKQATSSVASKADVKSLAPKINFQGKTTNEKLNLIAREIQKAWGNGDGFLYAPPQPAPPVEFEPAPEVDPMPAPDPEKADAEREAKRQARALSLNLRWLGIQQMVKPLLRAAFQVEGEICCVFSEDAEFICNNPLYELCICRAQGRPDRATKIHSLSPASPRYAPILRPEFLRSSRTAFSRKADFLKVRGALLGVKMEGSVIMDPAWKPAENGMADCQLRTIWKPVAPPHMPPEDKFEYRSQFLLREAINTTHTEEWSVASGEKRLEFLNKVQFRKSATEEYPASGWVTVTPISYNATTVMMFNRLKRAYQASDAFTKEVLATPEKFRTCSSWPALEVAVVRTQWLMSEIQNLQEEMTHAIADPALPGFP